MLDNLASAHVTISALLFFKTFYGYKEVEQGSVLPGEHVGVKSMPGKWKTQVKCFSFHIKGISCWVLHSCLIKALAVCRANLFCEKCSILLPPRRTTHGCCGDAGCPAFISCCSLASCALMSQPHPSWMETPPSQPPHSAEDPTLDHRDAGTAPRVEGSSGRAGRDVERVSLAEQEVLQIWVCK